VQYAFKKETKGERHGSYAERLLAANRPMQKQAPTNPVIPSIPKKQEVFQIPPMMMYPNYPQGPMNMGPPMNPNMGPPMNQNMGPPMNQMPGP